MKFPKFTHRAILGFSHWLTKDLPITGMRIRSDSITISTPAESFFASKPPEPESPLVQVDDDIFVLYTEIVKVQEHSGLQMVTTEKPMLSVVVYRDNTSEYSTWPISEIKSQINRKYQTFGI